MLSTAFAKVNLGKSKLDSTGEKNSNSENLKSKADPCIRILLEEFNVWEQNKENPAWEKKWHKRIGVFHKIILSPRSRLLLESKGFTAYIKAQSRY